jgi:hypothetical protein
MSYKPEDKGLMLPDQAGGPVAPVSVESLVAIVGAFDRFKATVLKEGDFWLDKKENKRRVKKSGWLKYALACNVSLEKIDEREVDKELPPGSGKWVTIYHFDYRAIAPNGRYAEASGSASTDERDESGKIIHDTRSLAQTRAMNRAISNLVGGGEISAEELIGSERDTGQGAPRKHVEAEHSTSSYIVDRETVLNTIEKAGLDSMPLNVYMDNGVLIVMPDKYLGDIWQKYMDALKSLGADWIRMGKQSRWEIRAEGRV